MSRSGTDFYIKQGDTSPSIQGTVERPSGTALSVVGATIRFHMQDSGGAVVIDAAAAIVNGAAGLIKYDWQAGDTDTVGVYSYEFEVTFSDASIETFPNSGESWIRIREQIA